MAFCNPLPLTEYSSLKSTFSNLLRSDLSFQLEECLLLLLTSLLKTNVLLMDEHLPTLHLELLEMCRETVKLVMLLPWNLLLPSWKFVSFLLQLQFFFAWLPRLSVAICFYPPLLQCCCWNEEPDRKGFLLLSSFIITSLELFFDLTDSVKWSLNYFPKRFSLLVSSNSALFFNMFFASWGEHTLDRMLYLQWYEMELLAWPSK